MTIATNNTARIAQLTATPDAVVGSDEGTHSKPQTFRIMETVTGKRYAIKQHAGNTISTTTEEIANSSTHGTIRIFPKATAEIRAKARELRELTK